MKAYTQQFFSSGNHFNNMEKKNQINKYFRDNKIFLPNQVTQKTVGR